MSHVLRSLDLKLVTISCPVNEMMIGRCEKKVQQKLPQLNWSSASGSCREVVKMIQDALKLLCTWWLNCVSHSDNYHTVVSMVSALNGACCIV